MTTVNGGSLTILVDGSTGEGDGIDSNGWLVINGGTVTASACGFSGDAGIDSDMGIYLNGGTVLAGGNMLDRIGESKQNFAVFQFAGSQKGGTYTLKNSGEKVVAQQEIENDFLYLVISAADMTPGEYTLWNGDTQLQGAAGGNMGGFGGMGGPMPEGVAPPQRNPEGFERPEGQENGMPPDMPEGQQPPQMQEGQTPPDGEHPGGMGRPGGQDWQVASGAYSAVFVIQKGENYFSGVTEVR